MSEELKLWHDPTGGAAYPTPHRQTRLSNSEKSVKKKEKRIEEGPPLMTARDDGMERITENTPKPSNRIHDNQNWRKRKAEGAPWSNPYTRIEGTKIKLKKLEWSRGFL